MEAATQVAKREPCNKGKIVGQKAPLEPKDVWALRVRLQMENRTRELAQHAALQATGSVVCGLLARPADAHVAHEAASKMIWRAFPRPEY